ncbi:MAG: DinB family protein [Balneolaceae bacterium]|nr:DinB family protein [Balneolaceae bacterium]MDR9407898.1 DinB family protein [Balneolaceae bacterium]
MKIEHNEYGEFYARYIKLSNNVPLEDQLRSNAQEMKNLFQGLSDGDAMYRYGEGKWTLKQVFGHIIDTERIFNYRALCLARGESKPLQGFDQDLYMKETNFNEQSLDQLQEQYDATRQATLALFSNFTEEELLRRGTISEFSFTVRATGYVIAGHEIHHLNIINEKYLPGIGE